VPRRDFLRASTVGAGTALGGLVGLGVDLRSAVARAQELRIKAVKAGPKRLPLLLGRLWDPRHTIDGKIVNIQGSTQSAQRGHPLPERGPPSSISSTSTRTVPPRVLHRAPAAGSGEEWDLERVMDRVAELVNKMRDESFLERLANGKLVNMMPAIFSLGGAMLDVECDHVQQKLMRGLEIVAIENQACI
jgi:formate dehydrogenase major subunit